MESDDIWYRGRLLLENEGPPPPAHVQAGLAVGVVVVVAVAGVMSGLTLGLLSMDRLDLELMLRTGNTKQERFARRLAPIISQPHWVLSTLVICNTAASMALPLCLDRLVNVVVALVLSTTAIVLFGEILPQAVCSRYGLSIGGHAAPVVRLLMWLTAPVSWPIGKALDALLGQEKAVFGKRQISALVDLHRESAGMGGPLNEEEAHVIQGVLDLSSKTGNKAMTPLDKVFMLSTDDVLDRSTLKRILDSGHSRIPVYRCSNRSDIIGLVLVKELLAVVGLAEPGSPPQRVHNLRIRDLPALPLETPMTDLLNLFQTGHSHMALLLQKQEVKSSAADKDAGAPMITAITCSSSSSSKGGSTPDQLGSPVGGSPPVSAKTGKVATLLKSLSGKVLKRSHSGIRVEDSREIDVAGPHTTLVVLAGGTCPAAFATGYAGTDESETLDGVLHAGEELHRICDMGSSPVADASAVLAGDRSHVLARDVGPHSFTQMGTSGASDAAAGSLWKSSGGALGRPSAASVWREAGWDAAVGVPVGIITLEDVLEELMQEEIVDETDAFIDNEKTCRVNARVLAMSLSPGLRRLLVTSQQLQQQRLEHQQQQYQQAAAAQAPQSSSSSPNLAVPGPGDTAGPIQGPGGVTRTSQGPGSSRSGVGGPASDRNAAAAGRRSQQSLWSTAVG